MGPNPLTRVFLSQNAGGRDKQRRGHRRTGQEAAMDELTNAPCCSLCRGVAPFHFCKNKQCAQCHAIQNMSDNGRNTTYSDPTADRALGLY